MEISLCNRADVSTAISHARSIALSAYVLPAESALVRALGDAAQRGAHVGVILDGAPYLGAGAAGAVPNPNLATAEFLKRRGVSVHLSEQAEPPVHLKAAVIDGRAFLDDRNWPATGRDTVVETDDPTAVAAIGAALAGRPQSDGDLALQKTAALEMEATLIRASDDRIDCASESFGAGPVARALAERARAGAAVRLEVNARVVADDPSGCKHRVLASLEACGVAVRAVGSAEKFAVAGDRSWLGSANATAAEGAMLDWGVRSGDPRLAATLEGAFERAWARGAPVEANQAPKSDAAVAFVRATTSATLAPNSSATYAAVAAI